MTDLAPLTDADLLVLARDVQRGALSDIYRLTLMGEQGASAIEARQETADRAADEIKRLEALIPDAPEPVTAAPVEEPVENKGVLVNENDGPPPAPQDHKPELIEPTDNDLTKTKKT